MLKIEDITANGYERVVCFVMNMGFIVALPSTAQNSARP